MVVTLEKRRERCGGGRQGKDSEGRRDMMGHFIWGNVTRRWEWVVGENAWEADMNCARDSPLFIVTHGYHFAT